MDKFRVTENVMLLLCFWRLFVWVVVVVLVLFVCFLGRNKTHMPVHTHTCIESLEPRALCLE